MAAELQEFAEELHQKCAEIAKKLRHPLIIAVKGHQLTGRRLLAYLLAATIRCPLIKEDDFRDSSNIVAQASYEVVCQIAVVQVQLGLPIVIDSELSNQSQFNHLQNLAKSTESPLVIVECKPRDVFELWQSLHQEKEVAPIPHPLISRSYHLGNQTTWGDFQRLLNIHSDYDVGQVPKIMVEIEFGEDIDECVYGALESIIAQLGPHYIADDVNFSLNNEGSCEDKASCHHFFWLNKQESDKVLGPIYRCIKCNFIFHRSCGEVSPEITVGFLFGRLALFRQNRDDRKGEERCICCKGLLKGYFYRTQSDSLDEKAQFDLNCIFLPSTCRVILHEHQLELSLEYGSYTCNACGIISDQKLCYICEQCFFKIDPNCAWLPQTVDYDRHRHPFELSISPRDEYDEYYCDICQEIRDPNHWIYYCSKCDYPTHTRCLVPAAWPPSHSQ